MSDLSAEAIQANLRTSFVWRSLIFMPETSSTNDVARRWAREGAPDGALVVADYQAAGRGRLGRKWEAAPATGLLLSLIFRPRLAAGEAQWLTMVCGLAAVEAVAAETGLRAGLKWPNDVLLGDAKLGGILTEVELSGSQVDWAVVGVGLNVNLVPGELAGLLQAPAISLSLALGQTVARLPLLCTFLARVERRYAALPANAAALKADWAARLVTIGREVVVSAGDREIEGLAVGVDARGALLVRRADGEMEHVLAGDVTLRPAASSGPYR